MNATVIAVMVLGWLLLLASAFVLDRWLGPIRFVPRVNLPGLATGTFLLLVLVTLIVSLFP